MSHATAKLVCEALGGFLAEVPYGPQLNHWIVLQLLDRVKAQGEQSMCIYRWAPSGLGWAISIVGIYYPS